MDIVSSNLQQALKLAPGPERTASLAEWFQGLYSEGETIPVLVGGAAVELQTGGAYTTGDLDFVGEVSQRVARRLSEAGFRREGRHWVHEEGEVFVELPSAELGERQVVELKVGTHRVLSLAPEDLIVDRLAAWVFWRSEVDAVNAWLLLRSQSQQIDRPRLKVLARRREVARALALLLRLHGRRTTPTEEEVLQWMRVRS